MAKVTAEEIDRILIDLADRFGELDDGDDPIFGEFAKVSIGPDYLLVRHPDDDQRCVKITVEPSNG